MRGGSRLDGACDGSISATHKGVRTNLLLPELVFFVKLAALLRPLRPIDDGLIYHVINRGNNRQKVFGGEGDYLAFLQAMADLKQRKPFSLFGYCLMGNHLHLLIRPQEAPISRIVQSLLVAHTQRYHRCRHSSGHVWQGRFKSPVIQDDDHLLAVLRYIEANPWRAKLVEQAGEYRWSSFAHHGLGRADPLRRLRGRRRAALVRRFLRYYGTV